MLLEQLDVELRRAALELQAAILDELPVLDIKLKYVPDCSMLGLPSWAECTHGIVRELKLTEHDIGHALLAYRKNSQDKLTVFKDARGEEDFFPLRAYDGDEQKTIALHEIVKDYVISPTADGVYDVKRMLKVDKIALYVKYDDELYEPQKLTKYKDLKAGDVVACFPASANGVVVMTVTTYADRDNDDPKVFVPYSAVEDVEAVRLLGVNKNNGDAERLAVTANGLRVVSHQKTISKSLLFTKV